MKTSIAFIVLFAFCMQPFVLRADDDDEKMYKGIRFGYQNSQLSESNWGELTSFYAGFFAARKLGASKFLSLYTGLEYYETGTTENDDNIVKLGYINLPLNLRAKIGPVYGFGGFNLAFKVGETVKVAGVDVSDAADIKGFDLGGQLGLGAKVAFIGIEIKYNVGLLEIYQNNTTSHFQAGLCVYF